MKPDCDLKKGHNIDTQRPEEIKNGLSQISKRTTYQLWVVKSRYNHNMLKLCNEITYWLWGGQRLEGIERGLAQLSDEITYNLWVGKRIWKHGEGGFA